MKYLLISILFLFVGMANAVEYMNGTDARVIPITVPANGHSIFVVDVVLDSGDIAYTSPLDVWAMQFPASADTAFLDAGIATGSCFDYSGTDSVDVIITAQASEYAGDGVKPSSARSDTWASMSILDTATSDDGSINDVYLTMDLQKERNRYVRFKLDNLGDGVAEKSRCRIWWNRKGKY